MIGLFLRPDSTLLVQAVENKGFIHVAAEGVLPSVCDWLSKGDRFFLIEMFKEASDRFGVGQDEFYIAIPDDYFLLDCGVHEFSVDDTESLNPWIGQLLNIDVNEYAVSIPIEFKRKKNRMVTACAIKKNIIESLVEAATEADQHVLSIEPASFSYFRYINEWNKEHCVLEILKDSATIVSFSPIGGAFKLPVPELIWENLKDMDSTSFSQLITQAIIKHDAIAEQTYQFANTDIGIRVLSPYESMITKVPIVKQRFVKQELFCPFVKSGPMGAAVSELVVPIGTVLQPLEAVMCDAFTSTD